MRNQLDLWKPQTLWRPFDELQRSINRLFEDTLQEPASEESYAMAPYCDVEEMENHYLLNFDVPGVAKEDIKVEIIGENTLSVSGERKEEFKEGKGRNRTTGTRYGQFRRTFTLPQMARAEKIEAAYENGVLRVVVPKSEEAKPKQVKISEGKGLLKELLTRKSEKDIKKIAVQ